MKLLKNALIPAALLLIILCFAACRSGKDASQNCVHDYFESGRVEASCAEDGYIVLECKKCHWIEDKKIPATGHKFEYQGIHSEGNCQNHATYDYVCSVCNNIKTEKGDLGNHFWYSSSTALCGEEGTFERTCSVCNAHESGITLGLSHDLLYVEGCEPVCNGDGFKDYEMCTRCEYTTYESIPATNHPNSYWTVTLAPTESTKGVREFHCPDCDEEARIEMPETIYTDFLIYEELVAGTMTVMGINRQYAPDVTEISIPLTYLGKPITEIYAGAFADDTIITTFKGGDNITKIGDKAFEGCTSLKTVAIPDSLTEMGACIFKGCTNIESITTPFTPRLSDNLDVGYHIGHFFFEKEENTVYFAETLAQYVPSSLKNITVTNCPRISQDAFAYCSSLEKITLTDGMYLDHLNAQGIDNSGCDSLTYNEYGNCAYIGTVSNPYYLLVKMSSDTATSIEIHPDTKIINGEAFKDNASLSSVTIIGTLDYMGRSVFENCSKLETVVLEEGINNIVANMFYNCASLREVQMASSITEIGSYSFYGCTSLYSIDIPSRVQRIGSYSFKESGLKRAYFADKDGWKEENSFDYNIDGLDDPATAAGLLIKYNTTRWDNRV